MEMAGVGFSLGCVTVLCMRHPDISVLFTFFRVETLLKFKVFFKRYLNLWTMVKSNPFLRIASIKKSNLISISVIGVGMNKIDLISMRYVFVSSSKIHYECI